MRLLQVEAVTLVLMDCQMPGLDGFETPRRWRALETSSGRGPHLPVVASTANAGTEERQRGPAAGMDDFLAKPFDLATLQRKGAGWTEPGAEQPGLAPASP